MNNKLTAVLVAASVAVATGCGSDSGDRTITVTVTREPGLPTHVSSMTKAAYIAHADRICRVSSTNMHRDYATYREEKGSQLSKSQLFAYATRASFLPHMQFWFDDISYLGTPKGDKTEVETLLEALQLAIFSGEERRVNTADELSAVFSTFTRLARQYGFDNCLVDEETFRPTGRA